MVPETKGVPLEEIEHRLIGTQSPDAVIGAGREGGVKFKLVGIGEVLWDLLPGGRQLGGAPANFAYHAHALGAEAWVVSRVGRDEPGRELLRRLEQLGLRTDAVEEDPARRPAPSRSKSRPTASRDSRSTRTSPGTACAGEAARRRAVAAADAVCFGTLAQRGELSRRSIHALLGAAPAGSLRILDVNLRQDYYSREVIEESLALASVLKVNETELARLAEMFGLPGDERGRVAELARRFRLRCRGLHAGRGRQPRSIPRAAGPSAPANP